MAIDLLIYLQPILNLMPNVPKPSKPLKLQKRLFYTFASLMLYLICSLVPLYGIKRAAVEDPMEHLRLITGQSKFTLMELGTSPVVTSSMIIQFLQSFGLITNNPKDPDSSARYQAGQKLAAYIFTAFQAGSNIFSGQYGNDLTFFDKICIFVQLILACTVIIVLDELCQSGYGIGSGMSLFICANISEAIFWRLFSFNSYNMGRGTEYEGAIVAFFSLLLTRQNKLRALREAVFRTHLPNLASLFSTIIIFASVIFFEHIQISIPLQTTVGRQNPEPYIIKLFYTSTTPIIIQNTIIGQLTAISKIIYFRWPDSLATSVLGIWQHDPGYSEAYARPISGLVYYLQAPQSIKHTIVDPVHTLIYLIFSLSSAGFIAHWYLDMSGQSPRDVAKQLHSNHLTIKGHRAGEENIVKALSRYIPTAAALGGVLTALLSFIADFLGAFGSGTGILVCVSIINQFATEISKEVGKETLISVISKRN